jgi:hypothetical protein
MRGSPSSRARSPFILIAAAPPLGARLSVAFDHAGFGAVAVTSVPVARAVLERERPGALVASVRLGPFNGLHLAHVAAQLHDSLLKIVVGEADPVIEHEAEGAGAQFMTEPVEPPALVALFGRMIGGGGSPPRRWRRVALGAGIVATVNGRPVNVVDIGYGGLGLELSGEDASLPQAFEVTLPAAPVTVIAEAVWQRTSGKRLRCGALVRELTAGAPSQWRAVVDTHRADEFRRVTRS